MTYEDLNDDVTRHVQALLVDAATARLVAQGNPRPASRRVRSRLARLLVVAAAWLDEQSLRALPMTLDTGTP